MMRSSMLLATILLGTTGIARAQETPEPTNDFPPAICVVENGALREVPVLYDVQTGDTLTLDRRRFSEAYPSDSNYVASARWHINDEAFFFNQGVYLSYGLPEVFMPSELSPAGTYRGVTVFVYGGPRPLAPFVFLPLRPGCVFQPYVNTVHYGAVRG